MRRPREVLIALGMLWLGLGFGGFEAMVAVLNRIGILPFSKGLQPGLGASEIVGLLGLLFQLVCIVSVARGHGLVRLPLLIGIGWIASRIGFSGMFRASEALAPYHRIEPLGLTIHTVAVGLLFLPSSNVWFRNMQKRRHEMTRSTAIDFERLKPPVG